MKWRCRRRELVVCPQALLSFFYQSGPEQVGQVARGFGLWHARDAHNIADAHFTLHQQMQNSQPRTIGESAKHQVDSRFDHKVYSLRRI